MTEPQSRYYMSQGLRLHYVDWGNEDAPPLLLVHGGRDHCRSWDRIARALQPHFHILAPDLRGHGDSDWTRGGAYSLTEYVYDIARLAQLVADAPLTLIGHSMGGMVSLVFTGAFPDRVARLIVLDGVTVLPGAKRAPAHERIAKYVSQLGEIEGREPHVYGSVEEAAARMVGRNDRLAPELALHLATHGVRRRPDGGFVWKFDPYQRAMAPHRLWAEDHVELWSRISCPTLLLGAEKSFLDDEKRAGLAKLFPQAHAQTIAGAGHWLHHDKPDEVLASISEFLGFSEGRSKAASA